ncbi:MAG TPA: EAL domain-containing protein [Patescibacteria group bacterium]|nr:EAL domain-containing protein [Patescibacteria group bacterium]
MEPIAAAIKLSPERRRLVTAALLFVFGLTAGVVSAIERSHYFAPMRHNDDLAQGTVNAVLQDRSGLIWIGTQGGLHRYDGQDLVSYQHQADVEGSLPESFVTAIAETADGALYVGTGRSGVTRFDHGQGQFVRVPAPDAADRRRDTVTALAVDARRGLWIGSQFGLELLTGEGRRQDVLALTGDVFRMVRDLAVCSDGAVLVATGRGAYRIGQDDLTAARIVDAAGDNVTAVHCGRDGSQWIANATTLFHQSGDDARLRWQATDGKPAEITDIVEDAQGALWLARHGAGLARFDPQSGAVSAFTHDPRIAGSLPEDSVRTLFVDHAGLLWVGGDLRGLSCTEPGGAVFGYLFDSSDESHELPGNNVRALLADGGDGLWIGTEGDGLKHYDFAGKRFAAHRGAALIASGGAPGTPAQRVTALADAGGGELWVGTPLGLARFDPATGSGTRLPVDPARPDALPSADVRALALGNDGSLWIGLLHSGLVRHDPSRQRWERFPAASSADAPGLWSPAVMAVHEDRGGRVWIGTLGGLNVYERATGRLHKVEARSGDNDGLAGDMVRSILETRDGAIWIGTHSGLNHLLSYENGHARFRAYRISDGLANDTIYGLLDDAGGRIWASTNRGVLMLDPKSGDIDNFTARDGLQGSEFNGGAQAKLGNGRLAFGGTRGLNWLDPADVEISRYEAPMAFTSVQIGSRRQRIDDPAQFREVRLTASDRVLMLGFAAMDFANPERIRFRYRLLGYDEHWVDLGTRHEVAFTNLGPGSYELEVLGSNRDGQFGTRPLTARVTVAPIWWQTTWARVAMAGLAALGVLGYVLWRRRSLAALQSQHDQLKLYSDRLSLALWASRDGFWDWDIRSDRMFLSGPEEFLGGQRETTVSADVWRQHVVHKDDRDRVMAALEAHISGEREHYEAEYRVVTNNRRIAWIVARGRATERDAQGRAIRVAGTFRDVSLERERDRDRRIAQEVIRSMGEAVCVTGLDFRFTSVNAAFSRITGYADHEVIGVEASILDSDQHPREFFAELRATMQHRGHWSGEMWQRRKDGEQFLSWLEINEARDAGGERTHWVAVISDITDRKRAEQELRYLANYDTLTGLPNRTLLSERLAHALIRARRLGTKVAVLFLDLDRFKHVNDSMGHAAGDRLLKSAAARIVTSVRESDTVARLGGDEFTVILEDLRDSDEAELIAQKVLTAFSAPLEIDGRQEVVITPSIGISLYPEHGQLPTDLLKHADTAMYHAKDRGRNTFQIYDDAMDTQVRLRANLASQLQRAMERKELSLVFQPKMSLGENRITGAEALLRWNNGTLGSIPPNTFIPIAEETGLIVPIGDWVLREACRQIGRWSEAGLTMHTIAVNVSALQLFRGDLVRRLREILAEMRVPAHRLELELTESMLMANPEQSIGTLTQIKALGVHLSVDDFGTGYSSLAYLKRLPIDTLKIDKTFVGDLTTDPDDEAIVSTVIMMAHSLGLDVIAEGVETNDQLRYLAEQKCDEVQGNLISAPLDADRILQFLLDRRAQAERRNRERSTGSVTD